MLQFYSAGMQFNICYKFVVFNLRSTTEQIPALVNIYNVETLNTSLSTLIKMRWQ
jgi:hypothetical protein